MAIENYTTYTEVDPNSRFTVTAAKIEYVLVRPEDAYVYSDKGVNFFSGDFTMEFSFETSASGQEGTSAGNIWAVSNIVDDSNGIDVANGDYLSLVIIVGLGVDTGTITLEECDGGTLYGGSSTADYRHGVPRYIKIVRDESVGTYGTLYLYVYSDAARTTLVHTSTITLHSSKKDFRYLFALLSTAAGAGGTPNVTGFSENLEVTAGIPGSSTVTTEANTGTIATSSTGWGHITVVGDGAPTQHGHVWSTSQGPTTSDSKTELGAKPQTGNFTSNMTDLIPGTQYYIRAYAINTTGTSYGAEVNITTLTTIRRAHIWSEGSDFHYFDETGAERVLQGHETASDKDLWPWLDPFS